MGHTRLGRIPKSRKWRAVVAQLAAPPESHASAGRERSLGLAAELADRTLDAASAGLRRAAQDLGLRYTFYLLTRLALTARTQDWESSLRAIGIQLGEEATIFDLTAELQSAVDDFLLKQKHSSDVSEMAQRAAGEAVFSLAGPASLSLFGGQRDDLQSAVRSLSTKNGFGSLGQRFFARFMTHFLNFYLSRATALQLGGGPLQQVGDISRFNEALDEHCEQSARVVRDFSAGWYSKTEYQTGIDLQAASRFVAVALEKLRDELRRQRAEA
jgi:hypothetical protein